MDSFYIIILFINFLGIEERSSFWNMTITFTNGTQFVGPRNSDFRRYRIFSATKWIGVRRIDFQYPTWYTDTETKKFCPHDTYLKAGKKKGPFNL